MKILHLISSKGFFGAENVVILLAKNHTEAGLNVCIGVFRNIYNPHLEVSEVAEVNKIPVKEFICRGRFDLRTVLEIRRFIKEEKIDLVHSHGYKSNFYAFFSGRNVRKVSTCHLWKGKSLNMVFYKMLDKLVLRRFDEVITVSEALGKEVLKSGINRRKVKTINNGVDVARFKGVARNLDTLNSFGINNEDTVVGAVGTLSEEKGHSYLLKAAKETLGCFPKTKFIIIGDGPLRKLLEAEAEVLMIRDKIVFAGNRSDVPELLGIIDIFVMPSLDEGMPMALLEAMASGRPVIATKVGGIPEMIKNGLEGLLVEPKDSVLLANCIICLLKDKNQAAFLAQNAFEKVASQFSIQKMALEYIEIYNQLLNGRRGYNQN